MTDKAWEDVPDSSESDSDSEEEGEEMEDWMLAAEEESEEEKEKERTKEQREEIAKKKREAAKKLKKKKAEEKAKAKFKKGEKVPEKKENLLAQKCAGMYTRYNTSLSQSKEVEEYFGIDGSKSIRVDLLEPKNEFEFYQYSTLVYKMIKKMKDEKHYVRFIQDLLVRLLKDLKKQDLQSIQKLLQELVNTPKNQRGKFVNIMGVKSKGDNEDLMERANDVDGDGEESDYNSGEDFM